MVEAAVAFIDREGLAALSMRRLGQELAVEAMALYRHPSRDDLLDAIVERVVDELYADPEVHLLPRDGWQDYLSRLARGVRRVALLHHEVFPLVASRPPAAPWVRPPLRSLPWIEALLEGLTSRDFTDAQAVYAYRAFTSFLLGHLLLEVSSKGVQTGPVADGPEPATPPPSLALLEDYPRLQRLAPHLADDQSAREFDDSLVSLLDRLA